MQDFPYIYLCSSLIGAALGARFKVIVLFPAILLGVVLVAAIAAIGGAPPSAAFSAAVVWTVSLQFGYFGGLLAHLCLAAGRRRFRSMEVIAAKQAVFSDNLSENKAKAGHETHTVRI
jgi:hypothetical protein